MVDLNKLMAGLSQSGLTSGLAGGLAGGALTGALMSKKGRKTAGTLLKVGGIAAVGGLAWNAYQKYQRQQQQQAEAGSQRSRWQPLPRERFDLTPQPDDAANGPGLLIVRAMITAAFADGHLDANEQRRIFDHLDTVPLSDTEKSALFDELRSPRPVEDIAAEAQDPAVAVEVYAASLVAIDESAPRARMYLDTLKRLLQLPDDLVAAIHEQAGESAREVAA